MLDATGNTPVFETIRGVNMPEYTKMKSWLADKISDGKKRRFAEFVTLTPALAQAVMERNDDNRPIAKHNSMSLAADIANNRFVCNGQGIIFSNTGKLIDGQHRASQVVATGQSIETLIVFGIEEEARFTIDTGRPKSVANFLAMKGKKYAVAAATMANYYRQYMDKGVIHITAGQMPTKNQILLTAQEMRGADRSLDFTYPGRNIFHAHAILSFCHFVFAKRAGKEAADEFMSQLIEGAELPRHSPIYKCREKLLAVARGVDANSRIEIIFRYWNAWRNKQIIKVYRGTGVLPKVER